MAPVLVRRVGHHGQLVLSGIPSSVERDVDQTYSRLGMRCVRVTSRGGWIARSFQASGETMSNGFRRTLTQRTAESRSRWLAARR